MGGNTPEYKDGVLRHFKDDFLQSEWDFCFHYICLCPGKPAPVNIIIMIVIDAMIERWTRSVAHIPVDAPLTADRASTAEDEEQCSRPPETPLFNCLGLNVI